MPLSILNIVLNLHVLLLNDVIVSLKNQPMPYVVKLLRPSTSYVEDPFRKLLNDVSKNHIPFEIDSNVLTDHSLSDVIRIPVPIILDEPSPKIFVLYHVVLNLSDTVVTIEASVVEMILPSYDVYHIITLHVLKNRYVNFQSIHPSPSTNDQTFDVRKIVVVQKYDVRNYVLHVNVSILLVLLSNVNEIHVDVVVVKILNLSDAVSDVPHSRHHDVDDSYLLTYSLT